MGPAGGGEGAEPKLANRMARRGSHVTAPWPPSSEDSLGSGGFGRRMSCIKAQVLVGRAVCTHTGAHAGRPAGLREPGAGVSGAHLEASRLPQPTPIRSSLCIILICLWGPGRKVLRLLLYFGCKLQPPLYKLCVIESIRGSFF